MRPLWLGLILFWVFVALIVAKAFASDGMMGVGQMMGPSNTSSAPPSDTFYLTNDAGDVLTDDAGTNRITTQ